MKKFFLFKKISIMVAVFVTCSLCFMVTTSAVNNNSLKELTLAPLRSEFEIAPGTAQTGYLTVTNPSTDSSSLISFNVEEFSVINQQYDYAFTAESNVAAWVSFEMNEVSLKAGESKKIKFDISVPLTAEPGGRYISLFAAKDDETGTSRQRIASLVYINVSGRVTRIGSMLSLSTPWYTNGVSRWSVVIQNKGTTHFRSRYILEIYNIFNRDDTSIEAGESLILPNTTRLIIGQVPAVKFPGIYKLVYTIGLGDTPAVIKESYILFLPAWLMIFILLIFIAYIIYYFIKPRP